MSGQNLYISLNRICIVLVILIYLAGQFLIGAFSPAERGYFPGAIFHMDFLNYASILKQFFSSFPPPNPNFAGVPLTQSWLHHLPAALLSQIISPILAIRIFNLIWIIAFILVLRRYFPSDYGVLSFLLLALSFPGWHENPLSLDLIIRSFHHTPFFLFFLIALKEKNKWLRFLTTLILPWLHGLLALAVFPFFVLEWLWERKREKLTSLFFLTLGLCSYTLFFGKYIAGSHLSFFWPKLSFKPEEPLVHALPFIPFIFFSPNKRWWLLAGAAFILGSLIQWNNYYFIFILNLSLGLAIIEARSQLPILLRRALVVVIVIGFIFFIDDVLHKYNPRSQDPYVAFPGYEFKPSLEWINQNTGKTDVFLIYPPDQISDIPLIQVIRPVYLGWGGFAEVLGLPAKERKEKAICFYQGGKLDDGINYIFYGPSERARFPDFPSLNYPTVYEDKAVTIYTPMEVDGEQSDELYLTLPRQAPMFRRLCRNPIILK